MRPRQRVEKRRVQSLSVKERLIHRLSTSLLARSADYNTHWRGCQGFFRKTLLFFQNGKSFPPRQPHYYITHFRFCQAFFTKKYPLLRVFCYEQILINLTIVSLFALSSELRKPLFTFTASSNFATKAALVGSTFFSFFIFSSLTIWEYYKRFGQPCQHPQQSFLIFFIHRLSTALRAPIIPRFEKLVKGFFDFLLIILIWAVFSHCSRATPQKQGISAARRKRRLRQSAKLTSAKVMCKTDCACGGYFQGLFILARICAGVKRFLRKLCVFASNLRRRSVVSRPAPEVPMRCFIKNVHFLLTQAVTSPIIYTY